MRSDIVSQHWVFEWCGTAGFLAAWVGDLSIIVQIIRHCTFDWLLLLDPVCSYVTKRPAIFWNRTDLHFCVGLRVICSKYIRCYSMQLSVMRLLLLLFLVSSSPSFHFFFTFFLLLCVLLHPLSPKTWAFRCSMRFRKEREDKKCVPLIRSLCLINHCLHIGIW